MFRDTDPGKVLAFGQVDMALLTHPPQIPNPGRIAVQNPLPKFWNDRDRYVAERTRVAEGLKGKTPWDLYHKKLPLGHVQMAQPLPDKF